MIFDELARQLKAISGVQFTEYEWKTRPAGNHGTVQLDFEAEDDNGDDVKQNRAWEGSVDLFTHGKEMMIVAAVESALETVRFLCFLAKKIGKNLFFLYFCTDIILFEQFKLKNL